MLLDDVMSELDRERRAALVELLTEGGGQALITTTDLEHVPGAFAPGVARIAVSARARSIEDVTAESGRAMSLRRRSPRPIAGALEHDARQLAAGLAARPSADRLGSRSAASGRRSIGAHGRLHRASARTSSA